MRRGRNPQRSSDADTVILHSDRHKRLAKKLALEGNRLVSVNRSLFFDLREEGIPVDWAFGPHWHVALADAEAQAEEMLSDSFTKVAGEEGWDLELWRCVNMTHFRYQAGHYLAAVELARRVSSEGVAASTIRIPVNPDSVSVLGIHFVDDSFALFLKALVPGSRFFDESTGRMIGEQEPLTIRLTAGFTGGHTPINAVSGEINTLVCPLAITTPWLPFVDDRERVALVAASLAPHGARARIVASVKSLFAPTREPLAARLRRRAKDRFPTVALGGGNNSFVEIQPSDIAGNEAVVIMTPWLAAIWIPSLLAIRQSAAAVCSAPSITRVIAVDTPMPEPAMLAIEAARAGRLVTLLPHAPWPTDIDLWPSSEPLQPIAATLTGRRWWADGGLSARLEPGIFPQLVPSNTTHHDVRRDPPSAPARRALEIIYVGCYSHEQTHPVFDPSRYFDARDRVLTIPSRHRGQVRIAVKPRPHWENPTWFRGLDDVSEIIPANVKLSGEFGRFDIAVVVEVSSTALLEAIARGCVAVVVSGDRDAQRWMGGAFTRVSTAFDRQVIPVVAPEDYWSLINDLISEPSLLISMREDQVSWLMGELGIKGVAGLSGQSQ